jgi:hypothetical protein
VGGLAEPVARIQHRVIIASFCQRFLMKAVGASAGSLRALSALAWRGSRLGFHGKVCIVLADCSIAVARG